MFSCSGCSFERRAFPVYSHTASPPIRDCLKKWLEKIENPDEDPRRIEWKQNAKNCLVEKLEELGARLHDGTLCCPTDLDLSFEKFKWLPSIPTMHVNGHLNLSETHITELPESLKVDGTLNISNTSIETVPESVTVTKLTCNNNPFLRNINCKRPVIIDISRCPNLITVEDINLLKATEKKLMEAFMRNRIIARVEDPCESWSTDLRDFSKAAYKNVDRPGTKIYPSQPINLFGDNNVGSDEYPILFIDSKHVFVVGGKPYDFNSCQFGDVIERWQKRVQFNGRTGREHIVPEHELYFDGQNTRNKGDFEKKMQEIFGRRDGHILDHSTKFTLYDLLRDQKGFEKIFNDTFTKEDLDVWTEQIKANTSLNEITQSQCLYSLEKLKKILRSYLNTGEPSPNQKVKFYFTKVILYRELHKRGVDPKNFINRDEVEKHADQWQNIITDSALGANEKEACIAHLKFLKENNISFSERQAYTGMDIPVYPEKYLNQPFLPHNELHFRTNDGSDCILGIGIRFNINSIIRAKKQLEKFDLFTWPLAVYDNLTGSLIILDTSKTQHSIFDYLDQLTKALNNDASFPFSQDHGMEIINRKWEEAKQIRIKKAKEKRRAEVRAKMKSLLTRNTKKIIDLSKKHHAQTSSTGTDAKH